MKIRLGTRGSGLALAQCRWVAARLRAAAPRFEIEEVLVRTGGDQDAATPLHERDGTGAFTKELEQALAAGEIDLAVHSLKDLPTLLSPGLVLAAIPARESPWDAWISADYPDPLDLPPGARVMTGSLRRAAQLRARFPALEVCGIRGNIDTRLAKYQERGGAGLLLAEAGLRRTARTDVIRGIFGPTEMTPAPGQGALGLETRAGDDGADGEILRVVAGIDDPPSRASVTAERALLARLGAGCHMPVGAIARVAGAHMSILAMVALADGSRVLRMGDEGPAADPAAAGAALAEKILHAGGGEILAACERGAR